MKKPAAKEAEDEKVEESLLSKVEAARAELTSKKGFWFEGAEAKQPRSGKQWKGLNVETPTAEPACYQVAEEAAATPFGRTLFQAVHDNTEGIAGVADLKIPPDTNLLVDVGGGEFDATKTWLEANSSVQQALVLDPFARSPEHNQEVQATITERGGADVVTSISVLNVVPEVSNRIRHLVLCHYILKAGGFLFIKVWPGMWPERGVGQSTYNEGNGVYQANAWVTAFVPEVEAVFGTGNVHCDANLNLMVAQKVGE